MFPRLYSSSAAGSAFHHSPQNNSMASTWTGPLTCKIDSFASESFRHLPLSVFSPSLSQMHVFRGLGMDSLMLGAGDTKVLVRCPWVATRASLLHQLQLRLWPSTHPPLHIPYHGRREQPIICLCRSGGGIRPSSCQTSLFSDMMTSAIRLLSSQCA